MNSKGFLSISQRSLVAATATAARILLLSLTFIAASAVSQTTPRNTAVPNLTKFSRPAVDPNGNPFAGLGSTPSVCANAFYDFPFDGPIGSGYSDSNVSYCESSLDP